MRGDLGRIENLGRGNWGEVWEGKGEIPHGIAERKLLHICQVVHPKERVLFFLRFAFLRRLVASFAS